MSDERHLEPPDECVMCDPDCEVEHIRWGPWVFRTLCGEHRAEVESARDESKYEEARERALEEIAWEKAAQRPEEREKGKWCDFADD